MVPASPYRGSRVALATRHGKERVIGRALQRGLGAELLHLPELDTDLLGSFCGSVPRQGTALEACIAKAELALTHAGTSLSIASEGSFGPHPAVPLLPVGIECMVFLDRERGLTISEQLAARRTNFAQRNVEADAIADGALPGELEHWLGAVGFPSHALIVRPLHPAAGEPFLHKGVNSHGELLAALATASRLSTDGVACLETDMRAHCNPTRMASIRRLAFRLIRRISRSCPSCGTPGWGLIEQVPGLPCQDCGHPTTMIRTEVNGCCRCDYREHTGRTDGLVAADPSHCSTCNP